MAHSHAGHPHGATPTLEIADRGAHLRRLSVMLGLVIAFMGAEVIGGLLSGSLALLADAGHMLSDAAALALSLFALWISQRPANPRRTYGYYRAEILAALFNGSTLIAIAFFIVIEACRRMSEPPAVQGALMMGVAVGGLIVNAIGLALLHRGKSESLNMHGAWLHVLSDALGSVGTIVAGILVWLFHWNLADPIASLIIAVLIVLSSWGLLRESVAVLMESTPRGLEIDEIEQAIHNVPGVRAVHDLHVWSITTGIEALSAHVVTDQPAAHTQLLHAIRDALHERFGINHVTIQIEPEGFKEPDTLI